jgi:hypothetical protein
MLPSGHSRSRRSGTVTPAMFPGEFFDLHPAARPRTIQSYRGAGLPQRLPDVDCPPVASRPTGLRRSFLRDPAHGSWPSAAGRYPEGALRTIADACPR